MFTNPNIRPTGIRPVAAERGRGVGGERFRVHPQEPRWSDVVIGSMFPLTCWWRYRRGQSSLGFIIQRWTSGNPSTAAPEHRTDPLTNKHHEKKTAGYFKVAPIGSPSWESNTDAAALPRVQWGVLLQEQLSKSNT